MIVGLTVDVFALVVNKEGVTAWFLLHLHHRAQFWLLDYGHLVVLSHVRCGVPHGQTLTIDASCLGSDNAGEMQYKLLLLGHPGNTNGRCTLAMVEIAQKTSGHVDMLTWNQWLCSLVATYL